MFSYDAPMNEWSKALVGKPQMGPGQKGPGKPIFSAEIIEKTYKNSQT